MEVGEWQHEVRQGVRRMVVRREQGAVGSVSRGEWGKLDKYVGRHHGLEFFGEEKQK